MEMNTPDGFALMNWETGYGDWIAAPGLGHAAGPALAREDRAGPRRRDRRGDRGRDPGRPADDPQAPGRARRGGRASPSRPAPSSSTTSSRRRGSSRNAQGWAIPERFGYYNEDYHLLQATKAEPLHRLLRNQMTEARRPDRVQQGRGRAGPARGQHPLRPRPRIGRPERHLQARRQGDRLPQRLGHHVHGQAGRDLDRAHPATCT